jgi:hypothetical protein
MPKKRFSLEDLKLPTQRGSSIRAIDGFVSTAQSAPAQSPDAGNFQAAGRDIIAGLQEGQKIELQNHEAGIRKGTAAGELDPTIAEKMNEEFNRAAQGLTDPTEIANAHRRALLKLRNDGVIPADVDPSYVIGVRRAEASRAGTKAAAEIMAQVDRFKRVEDEEGNLLPDQSGAASAAFDEIFAEASQDPVIAGSHIALQEIARIKRSTEASFFASVEGAQAAGMKRRDFNNRKSEVLNGWSREGASFRSVGDLVHQDTNAAEVRDSIVAGLERMRDEEGVLDTNEILVGALQDYFDMNVDEDPEGVVRVFSRAMHIPMATGDTLGTDNRESSKLAHQLLAKARQAEEQKDYRTSAARRNFPKIRDTAVIETLAVVQREFPNATPDKLFELVTGRLEQDEDYNQALQDADKAKPSDRDLEAYRTTIENSATGNTQHFFSILDDMDAAGEDPEVVEDYARSVLSPGDFVTWKNGEGSRAWNEISQDGLADYLRNVVSKDALPDGHSDGSLIEMTFLQKDAQAEIKAFYLKAKREGNLEGWTSTPEMRTLFTNLRGEFQRRERAVADIRRAVTERARKRDIVGLDETLEILRASVSEGEYSEAKDKRDLLAGNIDGALRNNLSYQRVFGAIRSDMIGLMTEQGEKPSEARRIASELELDFIAQMSEEHRGTITLFPPEEHAQRIAKASRRVYEELKEVHLSDEQKRNIRVNREGEPGAAERLTTALAESKAAEKSSISSAVAETFPDLAPAIDAPRDPYFFFNNPSNDEVFDGTLQSIALHELNRIPEGHRTIPDGTIKRWAISTAMAGGFSTEEITAGEGTLRVALTNLGPAARRIKGPQLEEAGFTIVRQEELSTGFQQELDTRVFYEKKVKLPKLHPTLTLAHRTPEGVREWIKNTPDAQKEAFYKVLELDTEDMPAADKAFRDRSDLRFLKYQKKK